MKQFVILKNRCVISIAGEDRKSFLQGLITNDVHKVSETQAIYSFMLSPQGRFLYDFFIVEKGKKLLVDCCLKRVDEIVQKLSFYKLRSKVEIKKEDLTIVVSSEPKATSDGEAEFVDPRNSEMGYRMFLRGYYSALDEAKCEQHFVNQLGNLGEDQEITMSNQLSSERNFYPSPNLAKQDLTLPQGEGDNIDEYNFHRFQGGGDNIDEYNFHRINLKLPDDSDLTFDKSFPLEFGFDDFNAVDYKKGCYVGQETTARTHYKGVIRKKVFLVEILECEKIEKGAEIEVEDKKIGEVLSSVFYQEKLFALALIKNVDNEGKEINFGKLKLTIAQNGIAKEIRIIK